MTLFSSPFDDVVLHDRTITEHIFAGLEGNEGKTVLIDGPSGATMTAGEFSTRVKCLAG